MSAESVQNSLSMNSPPLPPPPPPPSSSSNELANSNKRSADGTPIYAAQSSMMPSNFAAAPPPSMSPAAYQAYYQQYMQYMSYYSYGMYPGATSAAAPTMPAYYNYNQAGVSSGVRPTLPSPVVSAAPQMKVEPKPAPVQKQQTQSPLIKINIKQAPEQQPQQQTANLHQSASMENMETDSLNRTSAKKSRFSSLDSLSNVTAQQSSYEQEMKSKTSQHESQTPPVSKQSTAVSSSSSAPSTTTVNEEKKTTTTNQVSDIVYDINKWPIALKTYCAKVYQHYQTITLVSEDQVTKYLQQRITEAFNLKPDLNIGWDKEPLPDITSIRKVAPFSQQQIEQKKRMQEMAANQILAKKNQIAKQQNQQQKQLGKPALFKPPTNENEQQKEAKKRKKLSPNKKASSRSSSVSSRSSSRSSSSSSTTSSSSSSRSSSNSSSTKSNEDFISLSTNKNKKNKKILSAKNNNQKAMSMDVDYNLNQQDTFGWNKKLTKKQQLQQQKQLNNKNNKNLKQRKFILDTNSGFITRKTFKNIFQLAKEQQEYSEKLISEHHHRKIIGTNQDLEKEYLRLTGPPESSMIRPVSTLRYSLEYVLSKYNKTNDYRYICDQLKAIRQDLTVQMIQNEFTVEVYETHARIAIRNKDRDEFNQCQNQLKNLYKIVSSSSDSEVNHLKNITEFVGYRLLYNMLTKSLTDLNQVMKEIKEKYSNDVYLKHLLKLKNAWHLKNYLKFFQLYNQSNELSKCLIDLFIERERKFALKLIIKAYRPSIKLDKVSEMLAYESVQKCKEELLNYKLTLVQNDTVINAESSNINNDDLFLDCKTCNIQNL